MTNQLKVDLFNKATKEIKYKPEDYECCATKNGCSFLIRVPENSIYTCEIKLKRSKDLTTMLGEIQIEAKTEKEIVGTHPSYQSGTCSFSFDESSILRNNKENVGIRSERVFIHFPTEFKQGEKVFVKAFINRAYCENDYNIILDLSLREANQNGFEILIRTWHLGCVYSAGISWFAFTERSGIQSDVFNVSNNDSFMNKPGELREVKKNVSAPNNSKLFSALSCVDIYKGKNHRIMLKNQKNQNSFDLSFSTWSDTIVYIVEASYLVLPDNFRCGENYFPIDECTPVLGSKNQCDREAIRKIKFDPPFGENDKIVVRTGINNFDNNCDFCLRLDVSVQNVDRFGFELRYFTWLTSKLYAVGASWIAYSA